MKASLLLLSFAVLASCARTELFEKSTASTQAVEEEPNTCILRPVIPFCEALQTAQWVVSARVESVGTAVALPVPEEEEVVDGVPVSELATPVTLLVTGILREAETDPKPAVDELVEVYFLGAIDTQTWISGDGPLRESRERDGYFALNVFRDANEVARLAVQTGLYFWADGSSGFHTDWHFREQTISTGMLAESISECH